MALWNQDVLERLAKLERRLMGKFEEMSTKLDGIQAAASNISADVDRLLALIKSGPLTDAQATEILDRLSSIKDQADAIAAKTPEDGGTP